MSEPPARFPAAPLLRVHQPCAGVWVVTCRGDIDLLSARPLAEIDCRTEPGQLLIVDLTDVTFFGAAGISALLTLRERLRSSGGALSLVGARDNYAVSRVLRVAGLTAVFTLDDSTAAALLRIRGTGRPGRPDG